MLLPSVYIVSLNKSGDLIFSKRENKDRGRNRENGRSNIRTWLGKISKGISYKQFYIYMYRCLHTYTNTHTKHRERQTYNTWGW